MYAFVALIPSFPVAEAIPFPSPTKTYGYERPIAANSPAPTLNLRRKLGLQKRAYGDQICGYVNGVASKLRHFSVTVSLNTYVWNMDAHSILDSSLYCDQCSTCVLNTVTGWVACCSDID